MNKTILAICFAGVAAGSGVAGYSLKTTLDNEVTINANNIATQLRENVQKIAEERNPVENACRQYSKEIGEVLNNANLTRRFEVKYHPSRNLCYMRGPSYRHNLHLAWNSALFGHLRQASDQDITAFISERLDHSDIERLSAQSPEFTVN